MVEEETQTKETGLPGRALTGMVVGFALVIAGMAVPLVLYDLWGATLYAQGMWPLLLYVIRAVVALVAGVLVGVIAGERGWLYGLVVGGMLVVAEIVVALYAYFVPGVIFIYRPGLIALFQTNWPVAVYAALCVAGGWLGEQLVRLARGR